MEKDANGYSRLNIVASGGVGLAFAAATPTFAGDMAVTRAQPLLDPTTKYPRPPYPSNRSRGPGWSARWTQNGPRGDILSRCRPARRAQGADHRGD